MKYQKMHKLLEKLKKQRKSFYSIHDIEKIYDGRDKNLPILLHRFVQDGRLQRIMRGYYAFDIFNVDFEEFACTVKKPSYISLEYALYHHGLIDQVPESITLITTGKSQRISCEGKELEYSHIREDLYFGYEIVGNSLIATKEKALLDIAYLTGLSKRAFRFSTEIFEKTDRNLLLKYLNKFPGAARHIKKFLL